MLKLDNLSDEPLFEGVHQIEVTTCSLLFSMTMGDGVVFKIGTQLRMLSDRRDNNFLVETIGEIGEDKSIFWVSDWEVRVLFKEIESWSNVDIDIIRKCIKGDFL